MRFEFDRDCDYDLIDNLEVNELSRDDIVRTLLALKHLYMSKDVLAIILALIGCAYRRIAATDDGRPGMDFWSILVLTVLKQAVNGDFDRVLHHANSDAKLRELMGMKPVADGGKEFTLQTIIRNLTWLDEATLLAINVVIVKQAHLVIGVLPSDKLKGRADSFVVGTDVEYPIDLCMLADALRTLIRRISRLCDKHRIKGWRNRQNHLRNLRRTLNRVLSLKGTKEYEEAVSDYLKLVTLVMKKIEKSRKDLRGHSIHRDSSEIIDRFYGFAMKLQEQVLRRCILGETIAHSEKIFSVFEPHTRMICKGKAGVAFELGVPLCILEDQHQFILGFNIMWEGVDTEAIKPLVDQVSESFPTLDTLSTDKGFWSPEVYSYLSSKLALAAIPKKGRLNNEDKERQESAAFVHARNQHPGIESAINGLQHRGLKRVLSYGPDGFARTVGAAVITANLMRLGSVLMKKQVKKAGKERQLALPLVA